MINYSNSQDSIDYKKWIASDEDPRSAIVNNVLNSLDVKEMYEVFPGYRDTNVYVTNIIFESDTNTLMVSFSDGSVISIVLNSAPEVDLSQYVTKIDLESKLSEIESGNQWKPSVSKYSEISKKYPNPQDGWTVNVDDTDITYRYTGTEWIAISSNSIPLATSEVDGKMSSSDKKKLDKISDVDNLVKYTEFGDNRKTLELRNYDSISGLSTTGLGINLAMVSKWDVADYGSTNLPINLNGSKERPTYNDSKSIALMDDLHSLGVYPLGKVGSFNDIPSKLADTDICTNANNVIITFVVSNTTYGDEGGFCYNVYTQGKVYQTLYWKNTIQERTLIVSDGLVQPANFKPIDKVLLRNKAIAGPKLFSLTTDSTEDEIKSAMTSTISKELITSSDLDKCYLDGFMIKEEVMNGMIMVGWNGSAYTFTEVGLTSPKSDPSLKNIIINVTPEGRYSVVKNGYSSTIITKSSINSILSSYATQEWVEGKNYLTEHQDLSGYATESWVESKGYLTEHQNLDSYATKDEVSSTYQVKDDLATSSKNGVMSKEDKSKLDGLKSLTKVSQLTNDSNFITKDNVPKYSISQVSTGHYVYKLNETDNGLVTNSYKFYSIPNEIKFDMCKFYDELTWMSELGTETINLDGEEVQVSECTADKGPYLLVSYNDLSKLEFNEDESAVSRMEIVMIAYSMKESLSSYLLKSESSDFLTKSEASSTYVASADLERLVNEIISKGN